MPSLISKEHYDLMAQFEREYPFERLDREPKELWKTNVYQDGRVNSLFLAYRRGYSLGKMIA
jgi:hypothetical protein